MKGTHAREDGGGDLHHKRFKVERVLRTPETGGPADDFAQSAKHDCREKEPFLPDENFDNMPDYI